MMNLKLKVLVFGLLFIGSASALSAEQDHSEHEQTTPAEEQGGEGHSDDHDEAGEGIALSAQQTALASIRVEKLVKATMDY